MKFSDTRPPVNDGSQYLGRSVGEIIADAFGQHAPMLPRGFGKLGNRPMAHRYAAAMLRVQMRPDDWATWTDDEKRKHRNARKAERRAGN